MKAIACILICCLLSPATKAGDPYRADLLAKIYARAKSITYPVNESSVTIGAGALIPHYETPKGAVFCRMEDRVTRATKVWLKLGVQ
jgi:hypothetical protein